MTSRRTVLLSPRTDHTMNQGEQERNRDGRFRTTHWSMVVAAGARNSPRSEEALATLCQAYWYPLYAYVRRSGYDADRAQDATQAFFTQVMEKHYLRQADAQRGRFRSFILAALKHFLATERDRASALKRGGNKPALHLEIETAEGRYQREPANHETPERVFERRWALTMLERAFATLGDEYRRSGRAEIFEHLKDLLTAGKSEESYAQIGVALAMSEGAVKVAVHRLRRAFGDSLRAEIAHTVQGAREIDDEIRYLFSVLRT
jgi:RNA polymerase sigma factor (sigma-70 family)